MASADVEQFVKLSFETDCCLDFVTEEIPIGDAPSVLRWIRWPSFNLDSVVRLLDLMEPDTKVRVGRCHGPFLEFCRHRPGMRYGCIRGMFKRAVEKVEGADVLGYSRILAERHGYVLLWNDE